MRYLPYILTGVFMVATAIQTIYIHDTNVLLDAKDRRIAALDVKSDQCNKLYDAVGDYVDVTNQLKARGWSDSVLPPAK